MSADDSRLSAADRAMIARAAFPLAPRERAAFLRDVTEALRGRELGDGVLHRVVREVQRRYFDPPLATDGDGSGRSSRGPRRG